MATVTGLTSDRMQQIIDKTIVNANIVGGHLILTLTDGSTIDAGPAQGATGPAGAGVGKGTAFPASPTDGDLFIRLDQSGEPLYKYTSGTWVAAGGGLNKVTSFPSSPQDGDVVVRTDLNGSPLYAYSTENGWESQPRMGAVTVPYVQGNISTGVSIPNDVDTQVAFNLESYDTDNMHDQVTNTSRLTVRTPGRYMLSVYANWASSTGGNFRMIAYRLNAPGFNNAEEFDRPNARSGFPSENTMTRVLNLKAGDFIEIYVRHDIGGGLTLNALTADLIWLGGPGQTVDERGVPATRIRNSVNQSMPSGVETVVAFDTEDFNTDGMHSSSVNPTRLTIKTPGLYQISAEYMFPSGPPSSAQIFIRKNGSVELTGVDGRSVTAVAPEGTISSHVLLAAGDYIELTCYQNSGAAITLGTGAPRATALSAVLVGSGKTVTPFVRAYTGGASIPSGVNTAVGFEFETTDNDSTHDTVTNNSRFICRTAGVYTILAQAQWQGTAGGNQRYAFLQKNGSQVIGTERRSTNSAGPATEVSALVELAVGDYVELIAFQDSGVAIILNGSATDYTGTTFFSMAKVGAPNSGGTGIGPAQADVYTVATLPAANTFPNGRIIGVSDGAAGQQARMSMGGAWINLG